MNLKKLASCFVILLFSETSVFAFDVKDLDQKKALELSQSQNWHRLLHYKRRYFGGYKSEADGPDFFFATNGKTNPLEELYASVQAFLKDAKQGATIGPLKQHPQCAFPARYKFLKKSLDIKFEDIECTEYQKWRNNIKGDSISLIFSAYFPGAPASMFGHTFLRVNNNDSEYAQRSGQKNDLLDYSIDFSAMVTQDNVILYSLFGIFGKYPGKYSIWPYYIKVKTYNNSESRDLIEYDLNFSKEEVDRLLSHLWELGSTYFDYYFFDENCSYQLLTLLEYAKPEWNLSNRFWSFVIPADTIKAVVTQENALASVKLRTALDKRMRRKWDLLSSEDQKLYSSILDHKIDVKNTPISVPLAEAINISLAYKQIQEKGELNAEDSKLFRQMLIKRASLSKSTTPSEQFEISRPDLGHHSSRVGLQLGFLSGDFFQGIEFRPALHDILNNDEGYTKYSQLEAFGASLRYYTDAHKFAIEKISVLEATSLSDFHPLAKKISHQLGISFVSPKDVSCDFCTAFRTNLGAGISKYFFDGNAIFYSLLTTQAEISSGFNKGWRIGPAPLASLVLNPIPKYKLSLFSRWNAYLYPERAMFFDYHIAQSFSFSQTWEARFAFSRVRTANEFSFNLNTYF